MGNARRIAGRIVAESEGARQIREEHELEQQWSQPPADRPPLARPPGEQGAEVSQVRFDRAMDEASSLLEGGPPALGRVLYRADDNSGGADDIREIATFCRAVAGEMAGGEMAEYFSQLGEAMEEYADAWASN